jgi:hypothetical protein
VSVEVLDSRNLERQTPVLTRQADGLWALSLGADVLARSKSRNELLEWALYGQGAKGVQTMPSAGWDFRKDDT